MNSRFPKMDIWSQKYGNFLKNIKPRFKATIEFFKNFEKPFTEIYPEDILQATIKNQLRRHQHPCAENEVVLEEMVQSIIHALKAEGEGSRFKRLGINEFDHLSLIIQKYCAVAAVAAYWELQIKFFAGKTGVEVYRDTNPGEHIETKYIKTIIEQILKKYPKINCNFSLPRDVRNCLLHGNLQQLRTIISPTLTEDELKSLDPKMAVLNLKSVDGKEIKYANDPFTKDEAKEMGPFFWFLSQGNTRLLEFSARILEKSLIEIKRISAIHAFSHHETDGFFEQIAIEGKPLTDEQKAIFIENQGHHMSSDKQFVADELDRILKLFFTK